MELLKIDLALFGKAQSRQRKPSLMRLGFLYI